jgi:hypothetical protein
MWFLLVPTRRTHCQGDLSVFQRTCHVDATIHRRPCDGDELRLSSLRSVGLLVFSFVQNRWHRGLLWLSVGILLRCRIERGRRIRWMPVFLLPGIRRVRWVGCGCPFCRHRLSLLLLCAGD